MVNFLKGKSLKNNKYSHPRPLLGPSANPKLILSREIFQNTIKIVEKCDFSSQKFEKMAVTQFLGSNVLCVPPIWIAKGFYKKKIFFEKFIFRFQLSNFRKGKNH